MRLSILSLGLVCLLAAPPAPASVHHRAAAHRGGDGAAARAHGTLARAPDGGRAWHAGRTTRAPDGGIVHARASGAAGADGRVAGGRRTTLGGDGTITRQGGVVAEGADGGTVRGGRNVQRHPDGSVQSGYAVSAQGADGGSFSQSGTRTRTAESERLVSRQTQASGTRGTYAGSTTRADGTLDHDSTITGANGNIYVGQTSYTRGQGLSHTGTCTNAQGQAFECK